jgi:hypothetical protein
MGQGTHSSSNPRACIVDDRLEKVGGTGDKAGGHASARELAGKLICHVGSPIGKRHRPKSRRIACGSDWDAIQFKYCPVIGA